MAKTDVAKKEEYQLPADLMDEIDSVEDMGYSEKAEDSQVPIVAILQDNSAEVKKNHTKRIEGAEPGFLIIRSLGMVLDPVKDEVYFQPCGFDHLWVQWQGEPGEGVPVGQFPFEDKPAEATERENADGNMEWRMPDGTRLVDTRQHYGHLLIGDEGPLPVVIPFGGTNHGVSRQWTAQMKRVMIPNTTKRAKSFMCKYKLDTAFTERGSQSWYKYKVSPAGFIQDVDLLRAGLELLKAVSDRTITAETGSKEETEDTPI